MTHTIDIIFNLMLFSLVIAAIFFDDKKIYGRACIGYACFSVFLFICLLLKE